MSKKSTDYLEDGLKYAYKLFLEEYCFQFHEFHKKYPTTIQFEKASISDKVRIKRQYGGDDIKIEEFWIHYWNLIQTLNSSNNIDIYSILNEIEFTTNLGDKITYHKGIGITINDVLYRLQ